MPWLLGTQWCRKKHDNKTYDGIFKAAERQGVNIRGDTWKDAAFLQRNIGYLPGEIALPSGMTGRGFLKMQMELRKISDESYIKKLL